MGALLDLDTQCGVLSKVLKSCDLKKRFGHAADWHWEAMASLYVVLYRRTRYSEPKLYIAVHRLC